MLKKVMTRKEDFLEHEGKPGHTLFKVRTAANLKTGFEELKKSWRTVIAGVNSRFVTPLSSVIALAASKITISALWRRQLSR